ncbi:hypothetical protein AXF42_Ash011008 [Apostasia shenzhenica]|uniref:Uncharacterized protein n=1 Tax=Apostasia shenzhenica TaxID=1088818 RepID=A0A2H9ZQV6_9ASPA|nr:hypothetical protein AXF42_Ash011008 [Apostasia shenzhenica]
MSKKKSFSGSMTMTLKDFHGGSIPSELALPSAPGISARATDRPSSWGAGSIAAGTGGSGRADHHRSRPGSAGGIPRVFEDRGSTFLSTPSLIGRHFDEDERKPFDASSAPRRPSVATGDAARSPPHAAAPTPATSHSDVKRPSSSPVVSHHLSPSSVFPTSAGNAWAGRKEAHAGEGPLAQPASILSSFAAASRFAQASAIEKVSSGRWQSKLPDVEVIRSQEVQSLERKLTEAVRIEEDEGNGRGRAMVYSGMVERKLGGFHSDGPRNQERARSPVHSVSKERNPLGFHSDLVRPVSHEGSLAAQHTLDDTLERPKLKLLRRTKPLEASDSQALDVNLVTSKMEHQPAANFLHMEQTHENPGSAGMTNPVLVGADALSQPVERRRLNLKPRSQPFGLLDENSEKESTTKWSLCQGLQDISAPSPRRLRRPRVAARHRRLPGRARPLRRAASECAAAMAHRAGRIEPASGAAVLKERGLDPADNPEIQAQSNWSKADSQKTEAKMGTTTFNRNIERESFSAERKNARDAERKDLPPSHEKVDSQRNPRRNDNWRNHKETEKPADRLPEPETWRKHADPPKPETLQGPRLGKAASALELAQAFSRSVSDAKFDNRYSNQKMLPGRSQVPFSRLTDTREIYSGSSQRQINGY